MMRTNNPVSYMALRLSSGYHAGARLSASAHMQESSPGQGTATAALLTAQDSAVLGQRPP